MMNQLKAWVSALLLVTITVTLTACNTATTATVATVNGVKISAAEFKYFVEDMKMQASGGAETTDFSQPYQDTTLGQYITDESLKQVINLQVQVEQAKAEGIEYGGEEDQKSFEEFKNGYIEAQGGRINYEQWLKKVGLQEETLDTIAKKLIVSNKLIQKYQEAGQFDVNDEELRSYYDAEYLKAKHILVAFPEATPAPEEVTGEETAAPATEAPVVATAAPSVSPEEETKAKADEVYNRVTTQKEDFDKVMNEITDDKAGLEQSPDGYIFTKGDMVPEFYEAALALGIGEISQPVKTSYGYHIIKRLDHKSDTEGFETMKETISGQLQDKKYQELIDSWKANFEIKIEQGQVDKYAAK